MPKLSDVAEKSGADDVIAFDGALCAIAPEMAHQATDRFREDVEAPVRAPVGQGLGALRAGPDPKVQTRPERPPCRSQASGLRILAFTRLEPVTAVLG